MSSVDTIIAKWKASFAGRTRYEGQEPREDELLVAEIERLWSVEARLGGLLVEASMHLAPEWGNPHDVDVMNRVDAAANDYEPHPTEPGLYRRKENKND